MRPIKIEFTGTTTGTGSAVVDYRQPNFKIGLGVDVATTGTYSVQHTFQDPSDFASKSDWETNAKWLDSPDPAVVNATVDGYGSYLFPIRGIRIVVAINGSGVTLDILQSSTN